MISRVAPLPLVRRRCRLGLAPRRALLLANQKLRQASDLVIHDKERMEAALSGEKEIEDENCKNKTAQTTQNQPGRPRKPSRHRKSCSKNNTSDLIVQEQERIEAINLNSELGYISGESNELLKTEMTQKQPDQSKKPVNHQEPSSQNYLSKQPEAENKVQGAQDAEALKDSIYGPDELEDFLEETKQGLKEGEQKLESSVKETEHEERVDGQKVEGEDDCPEPHTGINPEPDQAKHLPDERYPGSLPNGIQIPRKLRHIFQHRNLDADVLGSPAGVLIFGNPNKLQRPRKSASVTDLKEELALPMKSVRLKDLISKKPERPASDLSTEAMNNLAELRPTDPAALQPKDIQKLVRSLLYGFTMEQLTSYWKQEMGTCNFQSCVIPYSWIVRQRPWEKIESVPSEVRLMPKHQRAVQIARDVWKLQVDEESQGTGEALFYLKPDVFSWLFRSTTGLVEALTSAYLDRANNEEIDLDFCQAQLAIRCRQSSVPLLLERLDRIIQSASSKTVSVADVDKGDLSQSVLQQLERITKTSLQYNAKDSTLAVSWFADDIAGELRPPRSRQATGQEGIEDPSDVVSRLLRVRQANAHASKVQVLTTSGMVHATDLVFVQHHRDMRDLSWRDRLQQWTRCVKPIGKLAPDQEKQRTAIGNRAQLPRPTLKFTGSQTTNCIIATFGHVLHSRPVYRWAKTPHMYRALSPVVPHPASLTMVGNGDEDKITRSSTIVLHFSLDSTQAPAVGDAVPWIRLWLPVNADTDFAHFTLPPDSSLEAIIPWYINDVLLPEESIDVRLEQQRIIHLDAQQQSLKDFVAASELHLDEGRLKTPNRACFSVPIKWLSREPAGSPSKAKKAAAGLAHVPYQFMGLDIHQSVDVDLNGHALRYSTVEAGQHGGQRRELTLRTVCAGHRRQAVPPAQSKSFLQLVDDIVAGRLFYWHQGHELMKTRSREKFSADMMNDAAPAHEPPKPDADEEDWHLARRP